MKTKEQRISEMIGKTYGFIETGKIEIIFSGKLGTVKVMLRNRRQVLEVLKRFYNDKFGIMDWVDTVIINNPYEGWVKVNGVWKWRKKVIEIKITKKQVSRETKSDKKEVQSQKMKKISKKQNTVIKNEAIEQKDKKYCLEPTNIEGIKANWQDLILVDDYHEKRFKTAAAMKKYLTRLNKLKAQDKQQMLTFDVQRFARSETTAEMTITQLEELVKKMKKARDKGSCSSNVKITIDHEGRIKFNQQSAYKECIGEFYSYSK